MFKIRNPVPFSSLVGIPNYNTWMIYLLNGTRLLYVYNRASKGHLAKNRKIRYAWGTRPNGPAA